MHDAVRTSELFTTGAVLFAVSVHEGTVDAACQFTVICTGELAPAAFLAVTEYAPPGCLRMSFHSPKWPEAVPGIEYAYMIRPMRDCCELAIRVGDWSLAPDGKGQDYFDASVDFVADAAGKIKDIADRG